MRMSVLDAGNDLNPILRCRPNPRAAAPSVLKNPIHDEHRHVTAYAIALIGNIRHCLDHGSPQRRFKAVQLKNVLPGREIGIASAGKDSSLDLDTGGSGIVPAPHDWAQSPGSSSFPVLQALAAPLQDLQHLQDAYRQNNAAHNTQIPRYRLVGNPEARNKIPLPIFYFDWQS